MRKSNTSRLLIRGVDRWRVFPLAEARIRVVDFGPIRSRRLEKVEIMAESKEKIPGMGLGLFAIFVFFIGGLGTFAGLALWAFFRDQMLFGLGTGEALGYLLISLGISGTLLGVVLMRVFRNRGLT